MSKLDELIAELCPNGVEYKKLKEVASVSIGEFVHKNKQNPNGVYPVYNGGTSNTGFYDEFNRTANKIIISARGANAGFVNRVFVDFWAGNSCYTISVEEKYLDWNFTYYVLKSSENNLINQQQKGGIPAVSKKQVEEFYIPVPPLPVQQEIVRILDTFTELNIELNAELEARKKQYEYYRDELFGGNYEEMLRKAKHNNVKLVSLHELGKFIRGKRFVRKDMNQEKGVPCIHYGDLYTYYGLSAERTKWYLDEELGSKMRFAEKNDVIIVQSGENKEEIGIGVAWLGDEKVAVHDACYIFKHNINPKYISHFLRTNIYNYQIRRYVVEGKICSISAKNIGRALIPVPSLEEQQRIVSILDRFNTLCNDTTIGLPAEIEAREKQFKYYLNKLLDFKEVSS